MNDLELFSGDTLKTVTQASAMLSKSSIVPQAYRGKQADCFSALILGHSLGLNPMQSLLEINVIQGRPALSAKLMLAVVKRTYPKVKLKWDRGESSVTLDLKLTPDDENFRTTWDVNRAKALNLMNRDQYKKQLVTMLSWRCLSEAIRFCAPDAILGFYTQDEALDIETNEDDDVERLYKADKTPEQLELGHPDYIFPTRTFRGKALKDIDPEKLFDRYDSLEARTKKPSYKHNEADFTEMQTIKLYLDRLDGVVEGETC